MATKKKIKQLGAEIVPGTEIKIDGQFVKDGWTEKNFRPVVAVRARFGRRSARLIRRLICFAPRISHPSRGKPAAPGDSPLPLRPVMWSP
jgi:hypothetical protein